MKRTYLAVALLACGVSGVASATTNYAQATTTLNVSQETQMTIYGNPALMNLQSASTGTSATASDASQTISNTGTLTSSATLSDATSQATATPGVLSDLTVNAWASNGMATGTASESLTFIFNSAGTIILQIPYTLYATSNSTGMITLNGSGSSSVSGNWSTTGGALTGTVSDSVSSATLPLNGPQTGPQTSSADLDVVLSNTSAVQADYTLNLAAVATANFSAPVPEVPIPLMLSIGMLVPLISRRARRLRLV